MIALLVDLCVVSWEVSVLFNILFCPFSSYKRVQWSMCSTRAPSTQSKSALLEVQMTCTHAGDMEARGTVWETWRGN